MGDRQETCPLCGGPNGCGLAAGTTTSKCWCFETKIPADVLDRVPAEARNRSCICQTCATRDVSDAISAPTALRSADEDARR